jgi:hypothetical protein
VLVGRRALGAGVAGVVEGEEEAGVGGEDGVARGEGGEGGQAGERVAGAILAVERPQPHHLYWPALDVDLAVESIERPDLYPLKARA